MAVTMYQTGKWRNEIVAVDCTRVTASSVFRMNYGRERREARDSEYARYHDTEALAVAYLRRRLIGTVASAESLLANARGELASFVAKYGAE